MHTCSSSGFLLMRVGTSKAHSTNNCLESLNRVIKDENKTGERMPIGHFFKQFLTSVAKWSDVKKVFEFMSISFVDLDLWTKAYRWATSDKEVRFFLKSSVFCPAGKRDEVWPMKKLKIFYMSAGKHSISLKNDRKIFYPIKSSFIMLNDKKLHFSKKNSLKTNLFVPHIKKPPIYLICQCNSVENVLISTKNFFFAAKNSFLPNY